MTKETKATLYLLAACLLPGGWIVPAVYALGLHLYRRLSPALVPIPVPIR